jgi:hypothetical protein
LLRISTTTIKLECTKGGGGWGGLFWPKTLGYLWSIFAKHIYSTVWLTLDDIPEILSFQTVYDMTITLNCMLPKIDQACWGEGLVQQKLARRRDLNFETIRNVPLLASFTLCWHFCNNIVDLLSLQQLFK